MSKLATQLLIAILVLSSLVMCGSARADAQTIPTPSVPEFTVRLVNNSCATQPTTTATIDPYTGKQSNVTIPSQYVKDEYIEVQIKNQAFTLYTINYHNIDNRTVNLYFHVVSKGSFSEDWSVVDDSTTQIENYTSQYTTIKLYTQQNIPSPAQLDFKAQAIIGYLVNQFEPEEPVPPPNFPRINFVINGTTSDWSKPQTLTIPVPTPSPNPNPSPEPTPIEPALIIGVAVIVAVFAFGLILLYRIKRK
jgi:hypothetical protein